MMTEHLLRFFIGFIFGAIATVGGYRLRDLIDRKLRGVQRHTRFKMTWLVGGLVVAFIIYASVATYQSGIKAENSLRQSERTASEARMFAQQTRNCQLELLATLNDRAVVASATDQIALDRDIVMMDWMHRWLFPPPEIAVLAANDPIRQAWKAQSTAAADAAIRDLISQQRGQEQQRVSNPYPKPQYCGR